LHTVITVLARVNGGKLKKKRLTDDLRLLNKRLPTMQIITVTDEGVANW